MKTLRIIYQLALRECDVIRRIPIYGFCMVVFPVLTMLFFTSLMHEGQPLEMPVGVVDLDNTSTSRNIIRRLDAFQTSRVVAHYPTINEARKAPLRGASRGTDGGCAPEPLRGGIGLGMPFNGYCDEEELPAGMMELHFHVKEILSEKRLRYKSAA